MDESTPLEDLLAKVTILEVAMRAVFSTHPDPAGLRVKFDLYSSHMIAHMQSGTVLPDAAIESAEQLASDLLSLLPKT